MNGKLYTNRKLSAGTLMEDRSDFSRHTSNRLSGHNNNRANINARTRASGNGIKIQHRSEVARNGIRGSGEKSTVASEAIGGESKMTYAVFWLWAISTTSLLLFNVFKLFLMG